MKWIFFLQEFALEIKDRPGNENVVANHVSRLYFDSPSPILECFLMSRSRRCRPEIYLGMAI